MPNGRDQNLKMLERPCGREAVSVRFDWPVKN